MSQVRLLVGRFFRVEGFAIETLEALAAGAITSIPAKQGTIGCSLSIGAFIPRIP